MSKRVTKELNIRNACFTVRVGNSHFSDRNFFESPSPLSCRVKAWFAQRVIVKNANGAGNYPEIAGNNDPISMLPFAEKVFTWKFLYECGMFNLSDRQADGLR